MQSKKLRYVYVSVCLLVSTFVLQIANAHTGYGPNPNPVIETGISLISITCPQPISPSCSNDAPYQTYAEFEAAGGSYNIPSECSLMDFSYNGDSLQTSTNCVVTVLREYQITTTCGETFTCNQVVMITDDTPPVITMCAADVTLPSNGSCEVAYTPLDVVAEDQCGTVSQSNDAPSIFGPGTTTVTYTVSDDCGNTATCQATVTVEDSEAPMITCPTIVLTTQCSASDVTPYGTPAEFVAAGGTITDNCTTDITDFSITTQNDDSDGGSCPQTVTRTYVVTDEAGNTATCTQEIVVDDTVLPTFTVPADVVDVPCDDVDNVAITGLPTNVDDNCDTSPGVGKVDVVTSGSNGVETIERTWRVTDLCGNVATDIQMITTSDSDPPVAVCSPATLYIGFGPSTPIDAAELDGGSTDNCSSLILEANPAEVICNNAGTLMEIVLTVTDASGNSSTCTSMVTVLDTITPVLSAPIIPELSCTDAVPAPYANLLAFQTAGGVIAENCDATDTFILEGEVSSGTCPETITRTYSFTDPSGNKGVVDQVITINDTETPEIDCPADIVISETMICDTLLTITATATDNCMGTVITNNIDNTTDGVLTARFSGGTTEVIFIATDPCGNADTCTMSVMVAAAPKVTCPPLADDVGLGNLPTYADYAAFTAAGGSINEFCGFIESTFDYQAQFDVMTEDSCAATITETVTFNDGTQDVSSTKTTITTDTVPPSLDCSAQPAVFGVLDPMTCDVSLNFIPPTVTDNFGVVDTLYMSEVDLSVMNSTVKWYAEDQCGNIDSCEIDITIFDTSSPVFLMGDTTLMCEEQFPQFSDGASGIVEFLAYSTTAEIMDCNLDSASFAFVKDTIFMGDFGKLYTVSDIFNNESMIIHFLSVMDETTPMIQNCTDDIEVPADADMCSAEVTVAPLVATDNCNSPLTITNSYTNTSDASGTYPVGVTTVVWTVSDGSQDTTCTFTVTVNDTQPPVLVDPVDTVFVTCDMGLIDTLMTIADVTAAGGNITDNCGFSISFENTTGSADTIVRNYIAVDTTGNSIPFTQVIARTDFGGPVFDSLPDPISNIACNESLPTPETLTATDAAGVIMPVAFEVLSFIEDLCEDVTITYRWTAIDSCGSSTVVEESFSKLGDTEGPTAVGLQDTLFYDNTPTLCGKLLSEIPLLVFTDNCSNVDTVYTTYMDTEFPLGDTKIEWIAEDSCGLLTTVTQVINVTDNESPSLVCDSLISINLTDESSNYAHAETFVESSSDNCDLDTVLVRRLTEVCGEVGSDTFRNVARFCCEEVGDTVLVEVKVIDVNGNESTCTTTAVVSDKLAPSVAVSLPDVTISCGYPIDTTDLTEFGTYVFDEVDRDSIFLTDDHYAPDGFVGRDGLVSENCSATIADSIYVDIDNNCNTGTVTRIFTFTDIGGNKTSVEQTITIIDFNPFNADGMSIEWPATFSWDQCLSPAPDTSVSGAPTYIGEDQCSMVSATFKDLNFEIGNGGCAYIRRRWKVIDWCQYNDTLTPNPGLWTYNQDIYVNNVTAPVFDNPAIDTTVCIINGQCVGQVSLSVGATDDCTATDKLKYEYTIQNADGSTPISGSGSSFGRIFNRGTYTVTWTVSDLCGNETQQVDNFILKECKAPTAICLDGLAISLGSDGTVELWASDIDYGSSDNCTAQDDLKLSFSADPDEFGKTFTCDDLGDNVVQLWVTDLDGNQAFCEATVDIQDNNGGCNGNKTTVMGQVVTHTGYTIEDSKVNIYGAELSDYSMTDIDGTYAFTDVTVESDVEINVEKEADYKEGVNSLDLVKIQRHLLGMETFDSPYKVFAADINSDEKISAVDLLTLRKLILGVIDELPDNDAWRFVQKDAMSDDEMSPWPFTEYMDISQGAYVENGDFVGVKIGDVNNTIDELLGSKNITESRSGSYLGLVANDQPYISGEAINMPIVISRDIAIQAMQFTIAYDAEHLNVVGVDGNVLDISTDQISTQTPGYITVVWNETEAINILGGDELFDLTFEAKDNGSLRSSVTVNSAITEALAFDKEDDSYELNLDYLSGESYDIFLYQNKPNPFSFETLVEFDLPEDMEVSFKIFDASGKVFWTDELYYPAGKNTLLIDDELAGKKGAFYLKMDAPEFTQVITMIKIE